MRISILPATLCLAFASLSCNALASADDDALNLADAPAPTAALASPWRIFTEASVGRTRQRYGLKDYNTARGSLDVYYDGLLNPGWRLIFADRLDRTFQSGDAGNFTVNTFKEGYLNWRPDSNNILDAGRINARFGVALGYNPTDLFRSGAIRSVTSIDPNSLRENRLGTVMVRAQTLVDGGSLMGIFAPRVDAKPSDSPFSPDFGSTNHRNRWLLAASKQFSENINPQFLLSGGAGKRVQAGFNLSALLNQSTIGYVEWSGGSGNLVYEDVVSATGGRAFRQRLATGLTYTTAYKLSVTGEYEYNGAGLTKTQWAALGGKGPSLDYLRYRDGALDALELPTRSTLFFYSTWQDALINRLDLKAMVRYNVADRSRLNWLEARYHLPNADISLQLQHDSGNTGSEYGALVQHQMIQTLLTYYF